MAGVTGEREGWRGISRTERSRAVAGGIGSMGLRQVTPRWADDPVKILFSGGGFGAGGGCPPPEGNQEAGIEGGVVQVKKYAKISDRS